MSTPLAPQQAQTQVEQRQEEPAQKKGKGGSAAVQLKAQLGGKAYAEQAAILAPPGPWATQGATTDALQAKGPMDGTDAVHAAAAHGVQGGGGALPHAGAIQAAFGGHDVSGISAHVGGQAAEASQAMGATAYASGNDVAFASQPDLHTAAHEAAHIVQQRSGVSLEGGVGKTGDSYENHADKVADAVVAGKSAEPLLDAMGGGGKGAGVQQKAVQRESISKGGDISADEEAVVRERAARPGSAGTQQGEMSNYEGPQGTALSVANVSSTDQGGSMAENPLFEADAIAFEQKLGSAAYVRAESVTQVMAKKGQDYLMAKTGAASWASTEVALARTVQSLGSADAAWSGSVGEEVQAVLDAFSKDKGSVATRMCHLEGVVGLLATDIKDNTAEANAMLAQAGLQAAEIAKFRNEKGASHHHVPSGSEVKGQGRTRLEDTINSQTSTRSADKAGVTMSDDETRVQHPGWQPGQPVPTTAVKWEEGARKWMMNERNKWVFMMRQLSLPLGAGPSGTTNKLMNLGQIFGMSPYDTRLACIGYLLPANHHSLCEIMEGAVAHGAADYYRGRLMYTKISPWLPAELKAIGGGKFPHEGKRAAPISAPQPRTGGA